MLKLIIFIISVIIGFMILSNLLPANCWSQYPNNEIQAIQNCEGKQ